MTENEGSLAPEAPASSLPRRLFILSTGGAVASVLLSSCDAGTDPSESGAVSLRVTGVVGGSAGSVVLTTLAGGPSERVTITLPTAGVDGISLTSAVNVPPATYRIVYTPPRGHLVTGTLVRDVVVTAGNTETVIFELRAVGTLNVTVNGLAAGATNAGSLAISFQDGGAVGTSITLSPPAGGTSIGTNTTHPVGALKVTHTPPPGHAHVGGVNEVFVTLASGAVANASFSLREIVPVATGLLFVSDWGTTVGSDAPAVGDGGKWSVLNPGSRMTVVNASLAGIAGAPFANILRLEYRGNPSFGVVRAAAGSGWTAPAIGQTRFYRLYFYTTVVGENAGVSDHPVEAYGSGPEQLAYEWFFTGKSGSSFNVAHTFLYNGMPEDQAGGTSARAHRWTVTLAPRTLYRMEWALTRDGLETYTVAARVYDASDALIRDSSDFVCDFFGHAGHSMADTRPNTHIQAARANSLGGIFILDQGGHNRPGEHHYYGGFAVSATDWCGPYVPGETTG